MKSNFNFSNTDNPEIEKKNTNAPTAKYANVELNKAIDSFAEKVDHKAFNDYFTTALFNKLGDLTTSSIENVSELIHKIDVSEIHDKLSEFAESSSEFIGDFVEDSTDEIEYFVEGLVSGLFDF